MGDCNAFMPCALCLISFDDLAVLTFGGSVWLDAEREFHHDLAAGKLYWAPAATPGQKKEPPAEGLVVPRLDRLIQVSGSSAETPAKDIVLSGLTLMHSAPTFCCDHQYESISGGDWTLHRGAAVFWENATDSTMSDCLLDHPEGNGIILNGHTERLSITRNEVASSGDSSVISVGVARFMDGRANSHPRNNTISYNHLHHWGVWGKQTSAYFGGIAREQHVLHNVIHDGPRAGINQVSQLGDQWMMAMCSCLALCVSFHLTIWQH